jgi:hypothetical protein
MKYYLFIAPLFICSLLFGQSFEHESQALARKSQHLNSATAYHLVVKNGLIEPVSSHNLIYQLDTLGRVIQKTQTSLSGTKSTYQYAYPKNAFNFIESMKYENDELVENVVNEVDKDLNLTRSTVYGSENSTQSVMLCSYQENKIGNLTHLNYNLEMEDYVLYTYSFDKKSKNEMQEATFYRVDSSFWYKMVTYYNDKKNPTQQLFINHQGRFYQTINYEYDKVGHLQAIKTLDIENKLASQKDFTYNKNGILEKIRYQEFDAGAVMILEETYIFEYHQKE